MGSRAWILRLVGPSLFFAIYVYVCHQLLRFSSFSGAETAAVLGLTFIPFAVFVGLPLFIWSRAHGKNEPWVEVYQRAAHISLSYLSYLICLVLFRDVLAFFDFQFQWNLFSYNRQESLIILSAPFLFMSIGYLITKVGPVVTHRKLNFKNLPPTATGKKIVQISDLHLGPSVSANHIQRVVNKTNALNPDYIVLTGDIFDGLLEKNKKSLEVLSKLKAKEKIFFITGNHEYYWGAAPFLKKAKEMGFEILLNKNIRTADIVFAGISDPAARYFELEGPNLEKALQGTGAKDFVILLAHQPNIAKQASQHHISLQLSGHTHAGQFLPWSLMIGLFQKYARGLYKVGEMQLYVNIGTGYWGPADRLGTYCEITEITLLKS